MGLINAVLTLTGYSILLLIPSVSTQYPRLYTSSISQWYRLLTTFSSTFCSGDIIASSSILSESTLGHDWRGYLMRMAAGMPGNADSIFRHGRTTQNMVPNPPCKRIRPMGCGPS